MLITNHKKDWYMCTGKINNKRVSGYGTTAIEAFNSTMKDYLVIINLYK